MHFQLLLGRILLFNLVVQIFEALCSLPFVFDRLCDCFRHKGLGFIWLAVLVVIAEFLIVISRFVFSYEQPFMSDLVRMLWYAALFLIASANALITEGHVRVDVFYAKMQPENRALSNALGSVLLGLPLCWVILLIGMWDKGSSINSPLRSFEISQQGFGMYTKYLMVSFLVVFALTMLIQFCSYFLEKTSAYFLGRKKKRDELQNLRHPHLPNFRNPWNTFSCCYL